MDAVTSAASDPLLDMTVEIVTAFISNNSIPASDVPKFIAEIHEALKSVNTAAAVATAPEEVRKPAVAIKRSVTPDYLICLEDGKQFKSLKRHLSRVFDLSPEQYRAKWGLPADYPMVAPNYAASRSALAKASGLGQRAAVSRGGRKKSVAAKR